MDAPCTLAATDIARCAARLRLTILNMTEGATTENPWAVTVTVMDRSVSMKDTRGHDTGCEFLLEGGGWRLRAKGPDREVPDQVDFSGDTETFMRDVVLFRLAI